MAKNTQPIAKGGVEPLSENNSTGCSPGADGYCAAQRRSERDALWWKRPTARGGCTTPEPPGTTGTGPPVTAVTSGQMSRFTPSATANCSTLRRKCRRASPVLFFGLRVSLLSYSRVLRASGKQGGTVERRSTPHP